MAVTGTIRQWANIAHAGTGLDKPTKICYNVYVTDNKGDNR